MRSDYHSLPGPSAADPLAEITAAMADPSFELDTGEAAVILSAVDRARAVGRIFDPFILSLVDVLRRQLIFSADGYDDLEQCVDDGLEDDEESEDDDDAEACPDRDGENDTSDWEVMA